jgi:hypothetical protein
MVLWELWKPGYILRCDFTESQFGFEVRCSIRDLPIYCRYFRERELTLADAEDERQSSLADGWVERPPMPP